MDGLAEGTVVGGRYVIGDCIGDGAMGLVYRAKHAKVGRPFAIKVLHPRLMKAPKVLRRFEREAELAAKLRHQNVVPVIDVGLTDNGLHYMAMELARGYTLARILDAGPFTEERMLDLAKQLCAGLAHAHDLGLIHRDFKPDNVIIEPIKGLRELARIADFGVAILREEAASSYHHEDRLTTKGLVVGTPQYFAPEQARGGALDHRADIYALGLICYEMLTGVLPFEGTGVDVARAHVWTPAPAMKERAPHIDVDPELEAIVMRLLAKDPDERYDSADDVLKAFTRVERELGQVRKPREHILTDVVAPISRPHDAVAPEQVPLFKTPTPVGTEIVPRVKARRVHPAVMGAALVGLVVAAVAIWHSRRDDSTDSVAAIDVESPESTAAAKDRRIHREAPPPMPEVMEQKDEHGVVEVPLPPLEHSTIPKAVSEPPSAREVATLYGTVGRELGALEQSHGMGTTIDLWPRYRWIRINEAIATPEARVRTTVMLQHLLQDIRKAQQEQP